MCGVSFVLRFLAWSYLWVVLLYCFMVALLLGVNTSFGFNDFSGFDDLWVLIGLVWMYWLFGFVVVCGLFCYLICDLFL